jgi:hypothetical protein
VGVVGLVHLRNLMIITMEATQSTEVVVGEVPKILVHQETVEALSTVLVVGAVAEEPMKLEVMEVRGAVTLLVVVALREERVALVKQARLAIQEVLGVEMVVVVEQE